MFYGEKDYLSNPKDVASFLLPKLKNKIFALYVQGFKHNDFVWGKEFVPKIFPFILKFIAQYNMKEAEAEENLEEKEAQQEPKTPERKPALPFDESSST